MSIADKIIEKHQNQGAGVADRIIQKYQGQGGGNVADRIIAKYQPQPQQEPQKNGGVWNTFTRNIIKPLASASNLLEDTGKTIGAGIVKAIQPQRSFKDIARQGGVDFLGHQKDVWQGNNQRTYSDILNEIAAEEDNKLMRTGMRTAGYAGDFVLDPLNKLKLLGLTKKGVQAEQAGTKALSMAEQGAKGERALMQFGKTPIIKGKSLMTGATRLNDAIRGTSGGAKMFDMGAKTFGKIRPSGVSRAEFKVLSDAKTAARNTSQLAQTRAIEVGKGFEKALRKRKVTDYGRSQLLHAIEKGSRELAPEGLDDLFEEGVKFKNMNSEKWAELGGSLLEGHGLSHVATDEVAKTAGKESLKGGKLISSMTPQDIHRQWVKVDGKIVNLGDEGVKYGKGAKPLQEGGSYINKAGKPVNVTQASAQEINSFLESKGHKAIFKEDLPTVVAKMGISTGRKEAGVEFLEATKGIKSKAGKELVNETYEKMTNIEAIAMAIRGFDKVQNVWKAQALMAPAYHVRNIAGNLWNNYLAGISPTDYALATKYQIGMKTGKLSAAELKLVKEMEKHGVMNTGWFGKDITQAIADEVGRPSINPFSQRFAGYRMNRSFGSAVEDNAKIAHFLTKRRSGDAKYAADSVKKYLFDYGDLTGVERQAFKRLMPFYTWTSKNIPLQVQEFFENPGKFSKIGVGKKIMESTVEPPDEKYLSDYISNNSPIRVRTSPDGATQYFLLGQWLPSAQAMDFLSQPLENVIGMISPALKLPLETILNKSSYFKDTLGEYSNIQSYPGQTKSYAGVDMNPKTINAVRSIRLLNELNKLNPGEVFGSKEDPSVWRNMGLDRGSETRGTKYSPDSDQMSRLISVLAGKTTNYDPDNSKYFYDRDTSRRMSEYKSELSNAKKMGHVKRAEDIEKKMREFESARKQRNQYQELQKIKTKPYY